MTLCFFIALALGVLTDVAVLRPPAVSAAVVRDARGSERRQAVVRSVRAARARRTVFVAATVRRILAPLTGASSPRAPARGC